ncbi:MAG: lipocalin-like domain-containing protein [Candidatus Thiodiazotropha sp.]
MSWNREAPLIMVCRWMAAVWVMLTLSSCAGIDPQVDETLSLPYHDAYQDNPPVQWWYWNGHLQGTQGQRFGFQLVFFAIHPNLLMTHVAITDLDRGEFHYDTRTRMAIPEKVKDGFDLTGSGGTHTWARGGDGRDHLHAEFEGYVLDLQLVENRPPVLHYDGLPHHYGFGGYTYYYSRPDMQARGTLSVAGEAFDVSGSAWFDRQFGDLEEIIDSGWQWFSLQLEDGSRVVLFDFGEARFREENLLVRIDPQNRVEVIPPEAYRLTAHDRWQSPVSGCDYPMGWTLESAEFRYDITPYLTDQEVRPKAGAWLAPTYWEGAARVEGKQPGNAYVELHGFCGN